MVESTQQIVPSEELRKASVQADMGKTAVNAENSQPSKKFTMSSRVSSLEQLQEEAPELYKGLLKGLMQNMMTQMRQRSNHLVERMKEIRHNSQ